MYIPAPTPIFIPTGHTNNSSSAMLPDWLNLTLGIIFEVILSGIFLFCLIYGIYLIKDGELFLGVMLLILSLLPVALFLVVLFGCFIS